MNKYLYSFVTVSMLFTTQVYANITNTSNDDIMVFDDMIDQKVEKLENISTKKPQKLAKISKKKIFNKIIPTKKEKIVENKDSTVHSGISLRNAILITLKRSNKIKIAKQKVIQAKRVIEEKYAALKPKLDLSLNNSQISLTPTGSDRVNYTKNGYSLTFKENLYAGGKNIKELKREKANLKAAQAKFKQKVEDEVLKIINAYYGLIIQTKSINATKKNMLSLQKILNIVKIKEESGAATKGDLNYIKSQLENAQSELVKQEAKYKNALSFYEYFVGSSEKKYLPIRKNVSCKVFDKDTLLKIMTKNNSKIQIAKAKIVAELYNYLSQKSKFKPTIDFSIVNKGKFTNSDLDPSEKRTTAYLNFNFNLYNGGKDKAKILGTKSKIYELIYKLIDLQESMEFNLKQIYETATSSEDSMKHTKRELDANKKVVKSYWNAFKYGTQDIQALLLAQRALNRSNIDYIKEEQSYISNYYKLLKSSGILLKELKIEKFIDPKNMKENKNINLWAPLKTIHSS